MRLPVCRPPCCLPASPCSLEPNESLASGVYAGQCTKCHTTLKFRVKAAEAAPKETCCAGTGKCGSKSALKSAGVGSPDPISSISFTLNGTPVGLAHSPMRACTHPVTAGHCQQPRPADDAQRVHPHGGQPQGAGQGVVRWRHVAHAAQGTKKSCQEGGCGACVVSLTQFNPVQQKNATFSVNSVCRAARALRAADCGSACARCAASTARR